MGPNMQISGPIFQAFQRSKCLQILLSVGLLVGVYCYYSFGSSAKISANRHISNRKTKAMKTDVVPESHVKSANEIVEIDVMITFSKAEHNIDLQRKFRTTVKSMFRFLSLPINLYILGDETSEKIATQILKEEVAAYDHMYRLLHIDIENLIKQVHVTVSEMQRYFTSSGAYYSDYLFFLSLVSHQVLPQLHKVIVLDCDLKFNADIYQLYKHFSLFTQHNIIGIAREAQPVYRHTFNMYRNLHKDTRVGGPPPDGLTGFNSGVLLLDLDRMRKSKLYNSLLTAETVKSLTEKYMFKGHLGDQDFYSLISLDHEDLFHILPCTWNRQLCTWWKEHGYENVFDQYFQCEGHINIYHGNCNTELPKLEWETT